MQRKLAKNAKIMIFKQTNPKEIPKIHLCPRREFAERERKMPQLTFILTCEFIPR